MLSMNGLPEKTRPDIRMDSDRLINEREIIAASKKDPVHFKVIYEYYYRGVLNYIYHRTNEINDAAEIASDVFYKALINLGKYRDMKVPFGAWLFRIAYNETMLHFRKSKKERYVILDEPLIENLAEEIETDHKQELLSAVKGALENLTPSELEIIDLKYFRRTPNPEIAYMMGISEGNLKVRAHRVIRKIKKLLDEKS